MSRSRAIGLLLLLVAAPAVRAGDAAERADEAFRAGRWAEASEALESCVAADAADVRGWIRLSIARLELGDLEASRRCFARATAFEPGSARVRFLEGRIATAEGEFDAAARSFAAVAETDASYEPAWTPQNLGYALHRLGKYPEARDAFRRALARPAGERHPRMYANAARNEISLGDAARAGELAREGRSQFDADPWLADIHGWALTLAGRSEEAEAALAAARSLAGDADRADAPSLPLPMTGRLRVLQGPLGAFSHRTLRNARAVDLVRLGADGREHEGRGERNEQHHCFDAPVLAVADGVVLATRDGVTDNAVGERTTAEPRGNFVYLRHDGGRITRYFHLRNGSVSVRRGARVVRGAEIGRCGNSGYSTRPHLCFGVAAAPPEEDVSVPFRFGPCSVVKDGRARAADAAEPAEGLVLEAGPR